MTTFKKDLQVFSESIQPIFEEQFATQSRVGLAIAGVLTWLRFLLQKRLVASLEESLQELAKRRTQERRAEGHLSLGASVDAASAAAANSIAQDGSKHDAEAMAAAAAAGGADGAHGEEANSEQDVERQKAQRAAEIRAHQREEEERVDKASADSFARDESDFRSRVSTAIYRSNDELVAMGGMATLETCSLATRSISLELNGAFDGGMKEVICRHLTEELGDTVEEEVLAELLQCFACALPGFETPQLECGGGFDYLYEAHDEDTFAEM